MMNYLDTRETSTIPGPASAVRFVAFVIVSVLLLTLGTGCTVTQEMRENNLGDETHSVTVHRFLGIPYFEEDKRTTTEIPE